MVGTQEMMNEKRLSVVTGASGFIGLHLVEALLERGDRVVGIDIRPDRRKAKRYRFFEHDIRESLGPVMEAAGDLANACWYHLAALTSPWQSMNRQQEFDATNLRGTQYVLNAASLTGAGGFVFASTSALYGEVAAPRLAVEDDPIPNDISPYAATKLISERPVNWACQRNGWKGGCLRLGNIYGPGQDPKTEAGVVAIFIEALLSKNVQVRVYGEGGIRDFVYVADCIDAFLRMSESNPGIYNIGTGYGISVWQILRTLEDIVEVRAEVTRYPDRGGETGRTVLNPNPAAMVLGWQATTSLVDGLMATVAWFQDQSGKGPP